MTPEQIAAKLSAATAGWKLVPVELTEAMCDAFFEAHAASGNVFASPEECWSAMLTATPTSPQPTADVERILAEYRKEAARGWHTGLIGKAKLEAAEAILAALSATSQKGAEA